MPARKPVLSAVWRKVIRSCADPARARHVLESLSATESAGLPGKASPGQARALCALFSGSQWAGDLLLKHPHWLAELAEERLAFPRRKEGLWRDVGRWLGEGFEPALAKLREFKQREMLRIAARDLARLADAQQTTLEISHLADVCLGAVLLLSLAQLQTRFGRAYHRDAEDNWSPTAFAVLGLGKLGGEELNYSSDVDLMFVYTEEGSVFRELPSKKAKTLRPVLSNHEFYKRLVQLFVAELARHTSEGMLYRIDLRLRPEGDAGPLVRSLASYESYYAQWGQTWERMMLIKGRCVAGSESLAGEFLEMIQPFRYPRSLNAGVLREIAGMKERTENEIVRSGEMDRNVKLGRGGIREIEFIAQTLQLLHAGRTPFLQGRQTLPALLKLVEYKFLDSREADSLARAYTFFRDVEHRLQMENNLQTHTIPADAKARARLARLMGCPDAPAFEKLRAAHAAAVRKVYDKLLRLNQSARQRPSEFPDQFDRRESEWEQLLRQNSFNDVDRSFKLIYEFVNGPGYVHVSKRTVELAFQLLPRLFALCRNPAAGRTPSKRPVLSDPDRVMARLDRFVSVYGARAVLFEMWAANPSVFEMLIWLFDRSEFLAERSIRTPDLVEDLILSGRLRRRKGTEEILTELRHGHRDVDQKRWLRKYHQTELMRIGLREIIGLADLQQHEEELTALAESCLQYVLEVALRKRRLKSSSLAIIGLGKLGGRELNYGSDLDITFVAPDAARDLPKLQQIAVEVIDLLTATTELGSAFQLDARLRPDGEKGLLVNTIGAYEEYYRQRAQLWELQALSRARPVAGNPGLGEQFGKLVSKLTDFSAKSSGVLKAEIARMRRRIEKERTPPGQDALAIKTGSGGLIDAEFIAQTICLERGWREPNTLRALERAHATGALSKADGAALIENYRHLRRIEAILRRWSYEGETVLPAEPAPYYRV
ncbi:MAG: bifunctional [glutamate--ammonia ligase]-adenylyl-L-tyrosine phosphorylase/[glutamate--ammonia-ligase] adenylyltransferase, partial [Verrucomicrobia subdivision 3 bacterium]|nr:bifunctional [glutamate--ammonia ligase]-adenylyl-L-tyrosine phosphorylase/[glutamate--ammonia-ligase] adenylyltransferase [Limisphaerales bacterium]